MKWIQFGHQRRIRQQTLLLAGQLSRWCQVREDLLHAFDKCLESGMDQPMRSAVSDLVTRLRSGMAVDEALDSFQQAFSHEHFQDLVIAIRFNFRYRGNLPRLLEHLEWQLNRIEEEYTRRQLSNARDRHLTAGILAAGPVLFMLRLSSRSIDLQTWINSPLGTGVLVICLAAYAAALMLFVLVQGKIAN